MADSLRAATVAALRDTVPFLAIMLVWIVVMLVVYGVFLATLPADVSYSEATYASVFVPPLIGFAGHTLKQARKET